MRNAVPVHRRPALGAALTILLAMALPGHGQVADRGAQTQPGTGGAPRVRPDVSRPRLDIGRPAQPPTTQPQPGSPTTPSVQPPDRPDASRPARPDAPSAAQGPEAGSESAEQENPRPAKVDVTVLAIIATNADSRIDPALRHLAEQLKPAFKFSGYRLAQQDTRSAAAGQTTTLRLIGAYSLQVTPTEVDAEHVAMNVQVIQGGRRLLGLQIRLRPGTYQLLGGWPVSGNTLLAAVTARPAE